MADECLDVVNERSSRTVTVSFFDDDNDPVTPTAATYRIDDPASDTAILPATSISPLGESVDIKITSHQNRIIKPRNAYEKRVVTVEFDYGVDGHGTNQYEYRLKNLYGVVDVPSASLSPSSSASPSV